ncbi:MAG: hypothetical protein ACU83U_08460 [Gammaproteobacteria bacterium]
MLQILTFIISIFLLNACSTVPSTPSVLVLPGTGKNFEQFRNDDLRCRQLVHVDIAVSQNKPDSKEEGQQSYDIGYIQCMYSKGHQVPVSGEFMYDIQQEWHPPAKTLKP